MQIRLDRIGVDGLDVDEAVTTEWLTESLGSSAPVWPTTEGHLRVHLHMADEVVHVRGHAEVELGTQCGRCLGDTSFRVMAPLEVALFPKGKEPPSSVEGEVAEDDMGIATYSDHEVDLQSVVRDGVLLALPMTVVCREDCAGLCDQCGADLNQGPCGCPTHYDLRWGALKDVKLS